MKATIRGMPTFEVPVFTRQQTEMLMNLSRSHYDAVCRAASSETGERGFIARWHTATDPKHWAYGLTESEYITWREIDTSLKIMEVRLVLNPEETEVCNQLQRDFMKLLNRARSLADLWTMPVDTGE